LRLKELSQKHSIINVGIVICNLKALTGKKGEPDFFNPDLWILL